MIVFETSGSFKNADAFLKKLSRNDIFKSLDSIAREGVAALASATPKESGLTAESWDYEVKQSRGGYSIQWTNSNVVDGVPVAILLQYGHGTGTGGYVYGQDYINPAIKPIFDKLADKVWKAVRSA